MNINGATQITESAHAKANGAKAFVSFLRSIGAQFMSRHDGAYLVRCDAATAKRIAAVGFDVSTHEGPRTDPITYASRAAERGAVVCWRCVRKDGVQIIAEVA